MLYKTFSVKTKINPNPISILQKNFFKKLFSFCFSDFLKNFCKFFVYFFFDKTSNFSRSYELKNTKLIKQLYYSENNYLIIH